LVQKVAVVITAGLYFLFVVTFGTTVLIGDYAIIQIAGFVTVMMVLVFLVELCMKQGAHITDIAQIVPSLKIV
jgi:hypothetical protein